MPPRQLHLFEPNKPLLARLGHKFFSAAPCKPGVYIMTGKSERVLYIGQSGNLRARLGSYKNARRDCAPGKIVRLVHLVENITYETCPSRQAAIMRESELLLIHRPKFNSMGVFPKKPKYIQVETNEHGTKLHFKTEESGLGTYYGPFKGDVLTCFGALCRTVWAVLHRSKGLEDFPIRLLTHRPAKNLSFNFQDTTLPAQTAITLPALHAYLNGDSDELLTIVTAALPSGDLLSPFQRALHAQDLETLKDFYGRFFKNKNGRQTLNPAPVP